MKKIKVGVMGLYRGASMIKYCKIAENAEIVAICDKWAEGLERVKANNTDLNIAYYDNFDDFIKQDMDAVVLANYATEHAPYAIKAMKAGKHVFSEVLTFQTMKEAVELIETVEETGKVYAYGENYCYMLGPYEMRRLYKQGRIGEIEYAECEYFHNGEYIWPSIAYGDSKHWRNNMYSTFYCTHSFGPIRHITGLRPVSVVGFEPSGNLNRRKERMGALGAGYGIEMVTLENGAIVKSGHGGVYRDSIWYSMYGSKGRMETAREDADAGAYNRIYVNADEYEGGYGKGKFETYLPTRETKQGAETFGHGGSDFWSMYNFIEKIKGDENADCIDVYEAVDMCLVGHFAYRSILAGGITMEIPDLRKQEERDKWRNDCSCVDKSIAGDKAWPSRKGGNPKIDLEIYEYQKALFEKDLKSEEGYSAANFKNTK